MKIETELADKFADNIFEKIKDEIDGMNCDDVSINSGKLWKLKKKIHKNCIDPPTAMRNSKRELMTDKDTIFEETLKYYQKVLENSQIKEGLERHKIDRKDLAKRRLEEASKKKTPDWDIIDLTEALKKYKRKNLLMHLDISMISLNHQLQAVTSKRGLLKFMNKIKQNQVYTNVLKSAI